MICSSDRLYRLTAAHTVKGSSACVDSSCDAPKARASFTVFSQSRSWQLLRSACANCNAHDSHSRSVRLILELTRMSMTKMPPEIDLGRVRQEGL